MAKNKYLLACDEIRAIEAKGYSRNGVRRLESFLEWDNVTVVQCAVTKLGRWQAQASLPAVMRLADRVFRDDHLPAVMGNVACCLRELNLAKHSDWVIDLFVSLRCRKKRRNILYFCGQVEYANAKAALIQEWHANDNFFLRSELMLADLYFKNADGSLMALARNNFDGLANVAADYARYLAWTVPCNQCMHSEPVTISTRRPRRKIRRHAAQFTH